MCPTLQNKLNCAFVPLFFPYLKFKFVWLSNFSHVLWHKTSFSCLCYQLQLFISLSSTLQCKLKESVFLVTGWDDKDTVDGRSSRLNYWWQQNLCTFWNVTACSNFLNLDLSSPNLSLVLVHQYDTCTLCYWMFLHAGLEQCCAFDFSVFLPCVFIPPVKLSLTLMLPSHTFSVVLECPWIAMAGFIGSVQDVSDLWSSQHRQGWELLLLALHSPGLGTHEIEIAYYLWAINYLNHFYSFCWRLLLWFLNS